MRSLGLLAAVFLVGCQEMAGNDPNSKSPNSPSQVLLGQPALNVWAAMSPEERAQARAAFAFVRGGEPTAQVALVVLDGALPSDAAALIVDDPVVPSGRMVVISGHSLTDAALKLALQAISDSKRAGISSEIGALRVTGDGNVTDPQKRLLFQLTLPEPSDVKSTEFITNLTATAASHSPIRIDNLGTGTVYRF